MYNAHSIPRVVKVCDLAASTGWSSDSDARLGGSSADVMVELLCRRPDAYEGRVRW